MEGKDAYQIFNTINDAKNQGKWICVGTQFPDGFTASNRYPNGRLVSSHAYYLKEYGQLDPTGRVKVTLINPWRYDPTPNSLDDRTVELWFEDLIAIGRVYIRMALPLAASVFTLIFQESFSRVGAGELELVVGFEASFELAGF